MLASGVINTPVTIVTRGAGGTDDMGNTIVGETGRRDTLAYVEQTAAREVTYNQETFVTDWLVVLHPGEELGPSDHIEVGLETLEVIGPPWRATDPWAQAEDHVEARCRSVR